MKSFTTIRLITIVSGTEEGMLIIFVEIYIYIYIYIYIRKQHTKTHTKR